MSKNVYNEDSIRTLNWKEHIREKAGMYIGKRGNGSSPDDGIYVLLKEVIDNSIDEFVMGNGKTIEVSIRGNSVRVRDFGRGIPLGKVFDCVAKINTGAKYDSKAFKKSVGLNGVGTKAVNALSSSFVIQSCRDGEAKMIEFKRGDLVVDHDIQKTTSRKGTKTVFVPDENIFGKYKYVNEYVEQMIKNYCYLNPGLTILYNSQKYVSNNGLKDLLEDNLDSSLKYPIIHLIGQDIEVAFSHSNKQYGEKYYSFVNGQYTTMGGPHQSALRESISKTVRDFFKNKNFEGSDVRTSLVASISIKVISPDFEGQTKTKLGTNHMGGDLPTVRTYVNDFVKNKLDDFLHQNPISAESMLEKILLSQKERKAMAGVKKIARERAKKASLHNKKLRDCRVHYNDIKSNDRFDSTIFITEGDSASGSITKVRDVSTQAVFSLKGKPLNSFGKTKKIVYENEEFNLLQSALNIEEGIDNLRYNRIIIATDADVDGMHIRLLLITFFLQFFPEVIQNSHLYILETPLFRVRNKNKVIYCYDDEEKNQAVSEIKNAEITRFKGLGEISPNEFKNFIGSEMRLEPIIIGNDTNIDDMLNFYMGQNTPERQNFIIDNLRIENND